MSVLQTLNLADLQKFAWLLTQLEADGVSSLAMGRQQVEEALRIEHRLRQRQDATVNKRSNPPDHPSVIPCPHCGGAMSGYRRIDEITGDTIKILQCDGNNRDGGCRYSAIVEVI